MLPRSKLLGSPDAGAPANLQHQWMVRMANLADGHTTELNQTQPLTAKATFSWILPFAVGIALHVKLARAACFDDCPGLEMRFSLSALPLD